MKRVARGPWWRGVRWPALCVACLLLAAEVWAQGGDANCDTEVTPEDVTALVQAFFQPSECPGADVNGDQLVNAADLVALVQLVPPPTPTATPSKTEASTTETPAASATPTNGDGESTPTPSPNSEAG